MRYKSCRYRLSAETIRRLEPDRPASSLFIVTVALPKGIHYFGQEEGVWVTTFAIALHIADILRSGLIQVSQATLSTTNKDGKMELLYTYLSGPAFRQKVEAIVEAFTSMKEDLHREQRAMRKIWSKREKQIERVITNTAGMYGDMQGIIGSSFPDIKMLDLEAATGDTDSGDEEMT